MGLTLSSSEGFWNALVLLLALVVLFIVTYLVYTRGKKDFTDKGEKRTPYLSGNKIPDDTHIKASNMYWGFEEALKPYYDRIIKIHTGIINDYVYWFVGVLAIVLIIVGGL